MFSLFKLMRNLINGTLISAKIRIEQIAPWTLEDLTVKALKFVIEQQSFEAPALQNGIENGWLKDFKSFREYFDFKVKTKITPSSLVNPLHNMTKDQISPMEISFDKKDPNESINDTKLREQKI